MLGIRGNIMILHSVTTREAISQNDKNILWGRPYLKNALGKLPPLSEVILNNSEEKLKFQKSLSSNG